MTNFFKNYQLNEFILCGFTWAFSLIFLANCNENTVTPYEKNKIDTAFSSMHFLWPAEKGSYWVYDHYTISGFGNNDTNWTYENFDSFGLNLDTLQIEPIIFQTEITDSIFITLNDTLYPSIVLNTGFKIPYFFGKDGIYNMGIFAEGEDTLFKKGLYIPRDIQLNKPWDGQISFKQEGKFQAKEVIDRRCLSIDETINTSMGNFECYVIKTRIIEAEDYPGFLDFYEYYAPNIGLVAKVRIFILPKEYWTLDYVHVLKTYHLVGSNN